MVVKHRNERFYSKAKSNILRTQDEPALLLLNYPQTIVRNEQMVLLTDASVDAAGYNLITVDKNVDLSEKYLLF